MQVGHHFYAVFNVIVNNGRVYEGSIIELALYDASMFFMKVMQEAHSQGRGDDNCRAL